MKIKEIKTGRILEPNSGFALRMIEQGRAIAVKEDRKSAAKRIALSKPAELRADVAEGSN